jgi:SAM-dependent methyltransferase
VRGGELDTRRVLVAPNGMADQSAAAELTLRELLEADPALELGPPAWVRLEVDPDTTIGELDADRRGWIAELVNFWRTAPRDVDRTTSPLDGMYRRTPDRYFPTGAEALRCVRLAMLEARKETCESILDFACGYGRVLRFFKAAFPQARLTACDISREAVDFCAEAFGATPVYSAEDPGRIELEGPFDAVWVGSLFTHVAEPRWIGFLDMLQSVLPVGGLLVFTVQGRNVRRELLAGEVDWPLDQDRIQRIVRGFDDQGFGYADWLDTKDYGTSLSRPSWVCGQIERRPGLRLLGYREKGWGRQDVVSCVRVAT